MVIIIFFDYRIMNYLLFPYVLLSLVLLVAVSVIGVEGGGARRWIDLGPFTLQPSEFAKLAVIWVLAYTFSRKQTRTVNDDFKNCLKFTK